MKPELAIVNSLTFGRLFPEHIDALTQHFTIRQVNVHPNCEASELLTQIRNVTAVIASVTPKFTKEVIENMPNLKIIARHGIGYDSVDVEACTKQGVLVTRVLGELERVAVAEHAIALLMAAARHVTYAAQELEKNNNWQARKNTLGYEITGKTIGLIGHGNIGSRTAEILKSGFNCKVLVYDPQVASAEILKLGYEPVTLEELCKRSLIILLHCNLSSTSRHLISAKEFNLMHRGVLIVNTARGEIIDEQELLKNLDQGKIFCYASDVVTGEPVGNDHPLVKHPKTLITPHIGNMTYESLKAMGDSMVRHVLDFCLNGKIAEESINGKEIREGLAKCA